MPLLCHVNMYNSLLSILPFYVLKKFNNKLIQMYIKIKTFFDIKFNAFFPNQSVLVNICPMEIRQ